MPFRQVVWLVPIVLLFHEAEEWNIMGWYDEHFVERPASALSVRIWLVLVTVDMFLVTWVATRFERERVTAFIMIPVATMIGANGLEHVYWLFYFEAYAPGVIFGGLVGVPVAVYLVRRAVAGGLVPAWYAAICGVYTIVTVVLVVRARNTMPPLIRVITRFSDEVARVAEGWVP